MLNPEQYPIAKALPLLQRALVGKSTEEVKVYLFNRDKAGRKVYDIAHKDVRDVMNKYLLFCGRFEVDEGYPLHISATSIVLLANDFSVMDLYSEAFTRHQTMNSGAAMLIKDGFQRAVRDIQQSLAMNESSSRQIDPFIEADADKSNHIDLREFEEYCRRQFGPSRRVAMKLMSQEDQYHREKLFRQAISSALPLITTPAIDESRFLEDIQTFTISLGRGNVMHLHEYKYILVMPAADRNFDSILRFVSPSFGLRMGYVDDIVHQLYTCHSRDVMHGDIKALNIVRLNGRMELIDLDASGAIRSDYAGAKFSSGALPPELFCELSVSEVEMYSTYWKDRIDISSEDGVKLWGKIKPRITRKLKAFVVKTFASDVNNQPIDDQDLPYELVTASADIDSWSLGMLYRVFSDSGKSLFKINQNDDLDDTDFVRMTSLTQQEVDCMIEKNILIANELIRGHLQVDPTMRWSMKRAKAYLEDLKSNDWNNITQKMTAVIHEDFAIMTTKVQESISELKSLIEEKTYRLTQVQDEVLLQVKRTEKVLLRGMIEATDVTVPSCFIILPEKLPRPSSRDSEDEDSMSDRIERAGRWLRQLTKLTSSVVDAVSDPKKAIQEKAKELFHGSELHLYLVDEYTMEPVNLGSDDPIYPIKINTPAKFVADVLPLMEVGLTAIKLTKIWP